MKKLLIIFLAIMMLAGIAGCGDKAASDPVTLTMWHVYGSQTESPFNVMIDEFNQTRGKETGVVISVVSVTNSTAIDKALISSAHNEPGKLPCKQPRYTGSPGRCGESAGKSRSFWLLPG